MVRARSAKVGCMTRELLTVAEMTRADRLTAAGGTPGTVLMKRAGEAVAAACLAWMTENGATDRPIVVLCGPGNNGGDGFVAAQVLRARGHQVALFLAGPIAQLSGDAADAARTWTGPVHSLGNAEFADGTIVVDALLGAGLSRPLSGEIEATVKRVNAGGHPVIAVDVPSGIHGDSGTVMGVSTQAAVTVTFFRAKPGHHLLPGAARMGRLIVADIGIPETVLDDIKPATMLNRPELWLHCYPWPSHAGHKYKRGHGVVVSGEISHTGAARLAARAMLRVGAGLVTLATPTDALAVNAAHLTAIMVRAADGSDGLSSLLHDARKNSVVLGPGLGVGRATCSLVEAALKPLEDANDTAPKRACVLDADALTSFAGRATELAAMIAGSGGPVVITPHDGEFERLFSADREIVEADSKTAKARAAAHKLGCAVLLKGPDTVVAEPGGRAAIATGDAPWLATAGSGDVLSGLVGGLLAQAMPPFEAANAAVWLHAEAARRFGPGLIAEDLPETLPGVLRELLARDQARMTSNQHRRPART